MLGATTESPRNLSWTHATMTYAPSSTTDATSLQVSSQPAGPESQGTGQPSPEPGSIPLPLPTQEVPTPMPSPGLAIAQEQQVQASTVIGAQGPDVPNPVVAIPVVATPASDADPTSGTTIMHDRPSYVMAPSHSVNRNKRAKMEPPSLVTLPANFYFVAKKGFDGTPEVRVPAKLVWARKLPIASKGRGGNKGKMSITCVLENGGQKEFTSMSKACAELTERPDPNGWAHAFLGDVNDFDRLHPSLEYIKELCGKNECIMNNADGTPATDSLPTLSEGALPAAASDGSSTLERGESKPKRTKTNSAKVKHSDVTSRQDGELTGDLLRARILHNDEYPTLGDPSQSLVFTLAYSLPFARAYPMPVVSQATPFLPTDLPPPGPPPPGPPPPGPPLLDHEGIGPAEFENRLEIISSRACFQNAAVVANSERAVENVSEGEPGDESLMAEGEPGDESLMAEGEQVDESLMALLGEHIGTD